MEHVALLLRQKLRREGQGKAAAAAAPSSSSGGPHAPPPLACCWLCAAATGVDDACIALSRDMALCAPCFLAAFHGILRPLLLLAASHREGLELAARVEAAFQFASPVRLAAEAVDAPLSLPASWACPRCTFGNRNDCRFCAVCGCASPQTLVCVHCRQPCIGANVPPSRIRANRTASANATSHPPRVPAAPLPPPPLPTTTTAAGRRAGSPPPQTPPPPPLRPLHVAAIPMCPAVNRPHLVWQCDACTVMNTVDAEACHLCRVRRTWKCDSCGHAGNTSRRMPTGERDCARCGAVNLDLSASQMVRLGIDPAEQQREKDRAKELARSNERLAKRLASLGLQRQVQVGDGNCQFRALAQQLLGSPEHHMLIRRMVTAHMRSRQHAPRYAALFESADAFAIYLAQMDCSGTWGDELTLRAVAEALAVDLHVVTSDEQRWHLLFAAFADDFTARTESAENENGNGDATSLPKSTPKRSPLRPATAPGGPAPQVFLLYLQPVHYDDIVRPPPLPELALALAQALHRLREEEATWDDCVSTRCLMSAPPTTTATATAAAPGVVAVASSAAPPQSQSSSPSVVGAAGAAKEAGPPPLPLGRPSEWVCVERAERAAPSSPVTSNADDGDCVVVTLRAPPVAATGTAVGAVPASKALDNPKLASSPGSERLGNKSDQILRVRLV